MLKVNMSALFATISLNGIYDDESENEKIQTVEHELGHAMGLDHCYNDEFSVMHPVNDGGIIIKPTAYDIACVKKLYKE